MCGIAGGYLMKGDGSLEEATKRAIARLSHRGPDHQRTTQRGNCALGHARLSIIDPDPRSHQPFTDPTGRYAITYNGEIYNHDELRTELRSQGIEFSTTSDTEVVLHLLIVYGPKALSKLNGFFAFAFHDRDKDELLIARDRVGIKPLYYSITEDACFFASELKPLLSFPINRSIDELALRNYLQLNYIPAPATALKHVRKLKPGHLIKVMRSGATVSKYYNLPHPANSSNSLSYDDARNELYELLHDSVKLRLMADVPLGSFLSGGLDSSVIAAIAAKERPDLKTYSIGYTNDPYFDETRYAQLVADKIGSDHTVFKLSTHDLYAQLPAVLNSMDEPFADSSAIAVHILSELTRKDVTVALSGDGADELFGGYNKHLAEWNARQTSFRNSLVKLGKPIWKGLPKSRSSRSGNLIRQLDKYAGALTMNNRDRYWQLATFLQTQANDLLVDAPHGAGYESDYLDLITEQGDLNEVLFADTQLVLPDDMLTKVDRMSMAHSLEVRTPFLDHRVVEFACAIPASYKVNEQGRKMILQDAFRDELPNELYNRPKKGFEVPMLSWMKNELKEQLINELLSKERISAHGIFDPDATDGLVSRLYSNDPGDAHATVWALIVFLHWHDELLEDL